VREVAALVRDLEPRPVLMFDMAHVLGLYGASRNRCATAPTWSRAALTRRSSARTWCHRLEPGQGSTAAQLWVENQGRASGSTTIIIWELARAAAPRSS
jgi:hypothetical protein